MTWLGPVPALRRERHFGDRVVRCFSDRPVSLTGMLASATGRNAAGEAIVAGAERMSWAALEAMTARLAGGLASLGVGKGDRIAILAANGIPHVATVLAAARLGAIWVPLNIREQTAELTYVLAHCGAKVLFHDRARSAVLPDPGDTPALCHRVPIDPADGGGAGIVSFASLLSARPIAPAAVAEEDVAVLLYTSGTTGRPKGAMISHFGLVHAAMIYEACMGLTSADRSVVAVPLSHVTGLTAGMAAMLRTAGTLVLAPPFKADDFVRLAAAERMTQTVMVPAQYNLILMSPALRSSDLSHWRVGGYGGAPMPEATIRHLAERLPGLSLMNAYGSTETTGPVVLMPPPDSLSRRTAVGRAVPVAEVMVVGDDGREAAPAEAGEIWLRSPNTVAGYWNDDAATRESFVAGFWRSGDIGSIDADGYLTLLDRKKDMINRGGFKIYSVEVENVLAADRDVVEAAVVPRPCVVLGERVHAVVVVKDGARTGLADDLRAACATLLADYKIPETFEVRAEPLPRNAAGKVLKRDLRAALPGR